MREPYMVITCQYGGVLKEGKWGLIGGPWGLPLPDMIIHHVLLPGVTA